MVARGGSGQEGREVGWDRVGGRVGLCWRGGMGQGWWLEVGRVVLGGVVWQGGGVG